MTRLSDRTREIYDRQAQAYDGARGQAMTERAWLDRALRNVPQGGAVLDLGCGTGVPIAAWLVARGYEVTGLDFAPAMLGIARGRLPRACFVEADIRDFDLRATFGAIIGWGSFFHLTQAEQRLALPRIARHLAPGGRLLLTVGPEAGETTGTVGGEPVYHASLSPAEYAAILSEVGAPVEAFRANDPECGCHTPLLARALS